MAHSIDGWMAPLGRILLASLFLLGALNKLLNWDMTLAQMRATGLPMVEIALPLVVALEGIGGAMVAFALPLASVAGVVLAVYTLIVNVVFHAFWTMEGTRAALELSLFFKNIAVAGGLVYAAATLSRWRFSGPR